MVTHPTLTLLYGFGILVQFPALPPSFTFEIDVVPPNMAAIRQLPAVVADVKVTVRLTVLLLVPLLAWTKEIAIRHQLAVQVTRPLPLMVRVNVAPETLCVPPKSQYRMIGWDESPEPTVASYRKP